MMPEPRLVRSIHNHDHVFEVDGPAAWAAPVFSRPRLHFGAVVKYESQLEAVNDAGAAILEEVRAMLAVEQLQRQRER